MLWPGNAHLSPSELRIPSLSRQLPHQSSSGYQSAIKYTVVLFKKVDVVLTQVNQFEVSLYQIGLFQFVPEPVVVIVIASSLLFLGKFSSLSWPPPSTRSLILEPVKWIRRQRASDISRRSGSTSPGSSTSTSSSWPRPVGVPQPSKAPELPSIQRSTNSDLWETKPVDFFSSNIPLQKRPLSTFS